MEFHLLQAPSKIVTIGKGSNKGDMKEGLHKIKNAFSQRKLINAKKQPY